MSDVDRPEVVAEVSAAFAAYERDLVAGNVDALDAAFWPSDRIVRFGVADRQRGISQIRRWRSSQGALPGRTLRETSVSTFGADFAVVTTLFTYPGRLYEGRQTQTWVRLPDGWRITSAHVSETPLSDRDHG